LCVWLQRYRVGSAFIMVLLAPYGRRFGIGLVFLRWTLRHCLTIFYSSLTQQAVVEHNSLFCSLFGLWVGLCGMKEIIGYSIIWKKTFSQLLDKVKITLLVVEDDECNLSCKLPQLMVEPYVMFGNRLMLFLLFIWLICCISFCRLFVVASLRSSPSFFLPDTFVLSRWDFGFLCLFSLQCFFVVDVVLGMR
jgi:hypothetical protein